MCTFYIKISIFYSIYPSPEQVSAGPNIPISNNTGSLPDLSNLHFPAPLITPLDSEEQSQQQQAAAYAKQQGGGPGGGGGGGGSNAGNLSPTSAHHHIGVCVNNQQSSPGERRRQGQTAPSPLVLHGSPNQLQHNIGTPQVMVNVCIILLCLCNLVPLCFDFYNDICYMF